jgi:chemotaxis protein MotB
VEDEPEQDESSPPWLTSFSDMVLLLLCFFVLLLSFARTDAGVFQSALGSVRQALGTPPNASQDLQAPSPAQQAQAAAEQEQARTVRARIVQQVEQFLSERGLSAQVEVAPDERGVILRTRDQILFDSGAAQLKSEGLPVLAAVADLARRFHGQLAIEGHTDDRPIMTDLFPSNWELSGARSAAVLRHLLGEGIAAGRVHVAGYADRRPIASNETEDGRARNRRVEFVFETEREADAETVFDP